jgi:phosphoribosyl-ATP pyrophosphohydrolase
VIIPSIDLAKGRAVQLVGGREQVLDAGAPQPWCDRFRFVGEIAVVDLDAALGRGTNRDLIAELCDVASCRVGGGIRTYADACWWLDRGACRIVIGTAAEPTLLRRLPRERLVVALDARDGEVMVDGWRMATGRNVITRVSELESFVGGFLVTFIEREGRLAGTDLARAKALRELAPSTAFTIAGGVATAAEIAALDRLGVDAQVGMALYTGALDLADGFLAPASSDRADQLIPTVVADEEGVALGLAWSSPASLRLALAERRGIYHSRTRGIWRKGDTSGHTQTLLGVALDCDRDALRFTVRQRGPGHCHRSTRTCWGAANGLDALESTIASRKRTRDAASYTARLLGEPALLAAKLVEEATEFAQASTRSEAVEEAADLIYFTMVRLAAMDATRADVSRALARRAGRITRRAGEAKALP